MTEYDGAERSTATETFRAMLDERGVEWMGTDYTEPTSGHATNTSLGSEYHDAVFVEYVDGTSLRLFDLTPEQAVEATLGRGTCRFKTVEQFIDTRRSRSDICECDRCGYRCARGFIHDERFKYCPNCGARIEVDE